MFMKENPLRNKAEAFTAEHGHRLATVTSEVAKARESLEAYFGPEVVVDDIEHREDVRKKMLAQRLAAAVPFTPETLAKDRLAEFDTRVEQPMSSLSVSGLVEMPTDQFPLIHESQPPLTQHNVGLAG